MGIVLLKDRKGNFRKKWFGRYTFEGHSNYLPLCHWKGTPPASMKLTDLGDRLFEESRSKAKTLFEQAMMKLDGTKNEEDYRQSELLVATHRLKNKYKRRLGDQVIIAKAAAPGEAYPLWESFLKVEGGLRCGKRQTQSSRLITERFTDFITSLHEVESLPLGNVSENDMRLFLEHVEKDLKLSSRVWNEYLTFLRRLFKRLASYSPAYDWLVRTKRRPKEMVSREIFDAQEILEITQAAREVGDENIRSMVIIASCTGLRLKDICLLKWKSVDLRNNTIELKTYKTKGSVCLPLWPLLKEELMELERSWDKQRSEDYVLPDVAAQYLKNPNNLLDRLQRILKLLGYQEDPQASSPKPAKALPQLEEGLTHEEILERVQAALNDARNKWTPARKERVLGYLRTYLEGKSFSEVAAQWRISKGAISDNLGELEQLTGVRIIRRTLTCLALSLANKKRGTLRTAQPEEGRAKRASLRGWHSFRGSFVMAALQVGADMVAVKKLLGSKTVEVIMEHYVKATPQFMKEGIGNHIPLYAQSAAESEPEKLLIKATPLEERIRLAASILKRANERNWKRTVSEALEILE